MIEPSEEFYEPETKWDFTISSDIKRVWKVELDMVQLVLDICKRHDLKCFAIGGTLLGAIRHQGYIPWDDDIDLGMLREDYDRFVAVAQEELSEPYFVQTQLSDPGRISGIVKIRNSNTTALDPEFQRLKFHMNQGIFVDVFPIDIRPCSGLVRRWQRGCHMALHRICYAHFWETPKGMLRRVRNGIDRMLFRIIGFKRICRWREQIFRNVKGNEAGVLSWSIDEQKQVFPLEWLRDVVWVPFEYIQMPVPIDYEKVLVKSFGDWHQPVRGASHHYTLTYDVGTPYKDYIYRNFGFVCKPPEERAV